MKAFFSFVLEECIFQCFTCEELGCFYRFNYVPLFRVKSVPPNGA
jgi:hypothetical protein